LNTIRRKRTNHGIALQTPIIHLESDDRKCRAILVLTAHLGTADYFDDLSATIESLPGTVFYESVRAAGPPGHARDAYHDFLRGLREDFYEGIAGLERLQFQGHRLAARPGWVNADVTCCELADRLRAERVSLRRQQLGLVAFRALIGRARAGDDGAARLIDRAVRWGLLAVTVEPIFGLVKLLPSSGRLLSVINDWRSDRALEWVLASEARDRVLVYGAAHGERLLAGFARAGYRETRRDWYTVFRA
jgi:hypothetical protein